MHVVFPFWRPLKPAPKWAPKARWEHGGPPKGDSGFLLGQTGPKEGQKHGPVFASQAVVVKNRLGTDPILGFER